MDKQDYNMSKPYRHQEYSLQWCRGVSFRNLSKVWINELYGIILWFVSKFNTLAHYVSGTGSVTIFRFDLKIYILLQNIYILTKYELKSKLQHIQ
jgi:hypothetical protein